MVGQTIDDESQSKVTRRQKYFSCHERWDAIRDMTLEIFKDFFSHIQNFLTAVFVVAHFWTFKWNTQTSMTIKMWGGERRSCRMWKNGSWKLLECGPRVLGRRRVSLYARCECPEINKMFCVSKFEVFFSQLRCSLFHLYRKYGDVGCCIVIWNKLTIIWNKRSLFFTSFSSQISRIFHTRFHHTGRRWDF